MKVAICMLVLIGAVVAEPPVPSNHYLPASHGNGIGYANGNGFGTPSNQYGAPLNGNVNGFAAPSAQYGAPSNGFQGLTNGNNGPAYHATGARSNGFKGLTTAIIRPNSQYGAPQRPTAQYGAPSTAYNGGYQEQAPASYQFQYAVKDVESANEFGHQEAREGDVAIGKYYVTYPDGRRQTVEYTADNEGYKPMISYTDVSGAYPAARHGNGGYRY